MRSGIEILGISCCFFLLFVYSRAIINICIFYVLNRSNHKKRKKGQNFWDWLWFVRFKDVLPKMYFLYYYLCFILYFVSLAVILILDFSNIDKFYFKIPLWVYYGWLICTSLLIHFSLFNWKTLDYDPGRVLIRKGRNKK